MGQAQINVRTRACSRTFIARIKQAALTHHVRGKELIKKQQRSYFSHIMQRKNSWEKSIMLGIGGGIRKRGRPRARWLDDIKDL